MHAINKRYIGIDQYGTTYLLGRHPRKELLSELGRSRAAKMYRDDPGTGGYHHVGYVVAGLWIEVYRLKPLAADRGRAMA